MSQQIYRKRYRDRHKSKLATAKRNAEQQALDAIRRRDLGIRKKKALGCVPVEVDGKLEWLSPMQDRFCRYYVLNPHHPTKAAYLAGYAKDAESDYKRTISCRGLQYRLRKLVKIEKRCMQLIEMNKRGIDIEPKEDRQG